MRDGLQGPRGAHVNMGLVIFKLMRVDVLFQAHVLGAVAQKQHHQQADNEGYARLGPKRNRKREILDKRMRDNRHEHRCHAAAAGGNSHRGANIAFKPAPHQEGHANHAAQAVTRAGNNRAQHELPQTARKTVDHEARESEHAGNEHPKTTVEEAVPLNHQEHADKGHQSTAGKHHRTARVAHARSCNDVALVHVERGAWQADVHEDEQETTGANHPFVVLCQYCLHAGAHLLSLRVGVDSLSEYSN